MNDSLSILIPIHNAESTLADYVHRLLEVAAELTSRFDVLILDDGSTDGTEDVARELSTNYLQVAYVRFPQRRGLVSALRAGVPITRGAYVAICDTDKRLSCDALARLWAGRMAAGEVTTDATDVPRWLRHLMRWGRALKETDTAQDSSGSIRLMHRDDTTALNALDSKPERPHFDRMRKRQAGPRRSRTHHGADVGRVDATSPTGTPSWVGPSGATQTFAIDD
ncbi:MAG: glycosyltransferase family 2 protein [Planctomycetota bacterium]|nr:MAG: glycosyltransferase family 2 protein [Planctomycetota bacterium]